MKFPYREFTLDSSDAFPKGKRVFRPIIRVSVKYGDQSIDTFATIDSGSDFCVLPSDIGKAIGIDIKSGKQISITGIEDNPCDTYFHDIIIVIGGQEIKVWAAFNDTVPIILLGQEGFFDRFDVRFNYRKKQISLTPPLPEKKKKAKK